MNTLVNLRCEIRDKLLMKDSAVYNLWYAPKYNLIIPECIYFVPYYSRGDSKSLIITDLVL